MPPNNGEASAGAPRRVRVFLALQFAGMLLLALSTILSGPLGLTLSIGTGFALLITGIVLAIAHTWRGEQQ